MAFWPNAESVLKVLLQWSSVYLIRVSFPASLSLDRDLTSQKEMSSMRFVARAVEGAQGGRIQPGILVHPAAQNCGAMEGEPPKVFTVSGQWEEVARDDKLPLHLPQRQAAQTFISIESGMAKNNTGAASQRPLLHAGASYGPQPPSATPSRRKFARRGAKKRGFTTLLTQPKSLNPLTCPSLSPYGPVPFPIPPPNVYGPTIHRRGGP